MTQQQPYQVIEEHEGFQVREYPATVLAQVEVRGSFEGAGNKAFRSLVSFIGGANDRSQKIAMTAPVIQQPTSADAVHAVSFVMPSGMDMDTMPTPANSDVSLHEVPEQLAVARRYSGRWTQGSYRRNLAELTDASAKAGFTVVGDPRYARYDPPWTPWFLRRNEVILPVERG